MPSVISVIDTKRSKRTLTTAFQTACMAAAAMTAKKTVRRHGGHRLPDSGGCFEIDVDEQRVVVGGGLGIVDRDGADARSQRRADEAMVELALSCLAGDLLDVRVQRTRSMPGDDCRVDKAVKIGGARMVGIVAGYAPVFARCPVRS